MTALRSLRFGDIPKKGDISVLTIVAKGDTRMELVRVFISDRVPTTSKRLAGYARTATDSGSAGLDDGFGSESLLKSQMTLEFLGLTGSGKNRSFADTLENSLQLKGFTERGDMIGIRHATIPSIVFH
ncbi:MAG TPA: hypothetical protein VJH94_00630 [Candidatus Paceibacterota bacterium]